MKKDTAEGYILEVRSEWIQGTSEQAPTTQTPMRKDLGTPAIHPFTSK